ncbi:Inositol 2-dehydrogenase/D-chiro-inositol 3-dehydrogenase [Rubripirellula tenax]|uniref:Inositol 2-dehydrogenase/D-chiro-inositol 3-dehydrogenase n=1 Tax=Rubripirellula tenax TaxID=2528015 RepID=A0A5C6EIH5_9BACT|nr:Gfo/Idh/MocA family oxidoreductase [Rubripirellula tenax]TWU47451.1 Inositol 2-dehydrogenase/D-chiro-inositol 3-dehydrogenase [Rubripirellula tenax]
MTSQNSDATSKQSSDANRRHFLKSGSVLTAGAATVLAGTRPVRGDEEVAEYERTLASSEPPIRIALVGAGGRGSGAINDSLSINEGIKLVAIADLDGSKLGGLRDSLAKRHEGKVNVADNKIYGGIDGYKRVLDDADVDVVLFATPPAFRPSYIAEAVDAGKHIFAEKPSCVDPAGYRICLAAHDKAVANGTSIVTGTQYRRQTNYVECIKRIHEGAIGDIVSASARYCSNGIWNKIRRPEMSDTEFQVFNWMHFIWLSGDQIVEQAVHNIDTINWIMGGPPESAFAVGGRFTRPEGSEMWDSMAVDYQYPGNRMVSFICRQIPGAANENANVIYGTKGKATIYGINSGAKIEDRDGKETFSMEGNIGAAYQQEHKDLIDSVRSGKPIVELKETADSSLTGVLGRVAAYTGQNVSWDFLANESKLSLFPEDFDINGPRPESSFAIPGQSKLI